MYSAQYLQRADVNFVGIKALISGPIYVQIPHVCINTYLWEPHKVQEVAK